MNFTRIVHKIFSKNQYKNFKMETQKILKVNAETNLDCSRIVYFKSDINYTYVHTFERAFLSSRTLKVLSSRIDNTKFMKVRRGLVVNKLFISKINLDPFYPFVELVNGERFLISRREYSNLKNS